MDINVDDDNHPMSPFKTTAGSDAFAFNVAYTSPQTLVLIENTTNAAAPNIILKGAIYNPIGTTEILNASGNIQSGGSQAIVTTNILDCRLRSRARSDRRRTHCTADLVQSENTQHVVRPIQVSVVAGGSAYLDLTGILRDPDFNPSQQTPFTVPVQSIQAGQWIVASLQESVQDTSTGTPNLGIVVYEDYTKVTTNVSTYFRPGTGTGPAESLDPGLVPGVASLIDSTYSFANLTAGGNIELTGVPKSTTVNGNPVTPVITITGFTNMNPSPSSTGILDASTNGHITLTETKTAMRVGTISSSGGNVVLFGPGQ